GSDREGVRPARLFPCQPRRRPVARRAARPGVGRRVPGRDEDGRRACRAAPPQARPAAPAPHAARLRVQGRPDMIRSLRGRLFAATLGALAVTLVLTIGIGAVLTRRQVDRTQAAALARRADDLAYQRRHSVSYVNENILTGRTRTIVAPRPRLRAYVPNVDADSDGTTTYDGHRQLYPHRTLPSRGLLLLRPTGPSAAWHPFLVDLLLAGSVGVLVAAVLSLLLARSVARPVGRVAEATQALAADGRADPVPETGP